MGDGWWLIGDGYWTGWDGLDGRDGIRLQRVIEIERD